MDWLDAVQWPAFAASVIAAWLVASNGKRQRNVGFWIFLSSNLLWVTWGIYSGSYGVIALQICLAILNIRGLFKTEPVR